MRAPHQEGGLPAPVKYGYLNVGVVEQGGDDTADLVGRTVFCLYPHQTAYVVPAAAVVVVPDDVPPRGRFWLARSRPRSTRCGTPPHSSVTGSPWSEQGWSAAASPSCCAGSPVSR